MRFGLRIPSIKKMISARLSPKRIIRHSLGLKMPRGLGIISNPKKYVYNKIYRRTSFSIFNLFRGKVRSHSVIDSYNDEPSYVEFGCVWMTLGFCFLPILILLIGR